MFRSMLLVVVATSVLACNSEKPAGGDATGSGKSGSTASAANLGGDVIAVVDGIPVTAAEFQEAASRRTPADGETLSAEERKDVLDKLVEEKVLYKEALARGLDKDPKVQKVMVNTLLRDEVYSGVRSADFTDQMLQDYYQAHIDEFVVPEKVQIRRILIKVTDERPDAAAKAEADRIHGLVKKDPSKFGDLAAEHSEDPYRRRKGDVGFVAKTGKPGLDQAVVDKAFELKVDQVSEVFKSDDGYNIVQLANRREKVERTFQQMKGSVIRKMKNDKLKELYEAYVGKLETGSKVEIDQAKVDGLEVSPQKSMAPGIQLGAPGRMAPPGMEEMGEIAADGEEPAGEE